MLLKVKLGNIILELEKYLCGVMQGLPLFIMNVVNDTGILTKNVGHPCLRFPEGASESDIWKYQIRNIKMSNISPKDYIFK